ncbi:MAG: sigma-70 family RNA polymerase sigma factor [Myxococcales bacterium]|nr:MAG: sigma-70 family RNA polymerase sigma factor [Myxococcales bacterium]
MKTLEKAVGAQDQLSSQSVNDFTARASKQGEASKKKHPEHNREAELRWVERARAGDHAAFEALFNQYRGRAYSVALGILKHPEDASDAVQEAFIKAYRNLGSFQGNSNFYTWFYRILMNLAIDHTRRRRRAPNAQFDEQLGHNSEAVSGAAADLLPHMQDGNPGSVSARRELREKIQAALETLSEEHRAVILLREIEGLSYDEIAEALEIPKGTVMSRLFHARKNMQDALSPYMKAGEP